MEAFAITNEIILVLGILALTALLFVSSFLRVDAVAVVVLALLGATNLLPPEQLFSGFSSEAVISLIAVMIISAGLENVGISHIVAKWMLQIGKNHPQKILIILMSIAGLLASFMRSLGTVALFLPIVSKINARTGISKGYLLMPIAFCAILGGTLTMVGTGPLIILNSIMKSSYSLINGNNNLVFKPFHLFEVMPIGALLLIVGVIYWIFASRKLAKEKKSSSISNSTIKSHFKRTYKKDVEIFELKMSSNSLLHNKSLKEMELALDNSCSVLAIKSGKEINFPPLRRTILKSNMTIAVMGSHDKVQAFAKKYKISLSIKLHVFAEILHPIKSGLCEAVIPPGSQLIGTDVKDLHMKRNHDIHVLALYRDNRVFEGDELKTLTIRSGDTLGMFSKWETLSEFQKHPDFAVITTSFPRERSYPKKMPQALFFFLLAIILVISGIFPISIGLLLGAIGMIATGVISIDKAYDMVSWKTVFLLAGLLPLGLVMQTSGTADWITSLILYNGISMPGWAVQSILAVSSTILALIISNIGATILAIPIALEIALNIGADPRLYALIVAIASSNTFLIPTHQVNALIAGPGGYTGKNFLIYGSTITVIYWVVMLVGLNLIF